MECEAQYKGSRLGFLHAWRIVVTRYPGRPTPAEIKIWEHDQRMGRPNALHPAVGADETPGQFVGRMLALQGHFEAAGAADFALHRISTPKDMLHSGLQGHLQQVMLNSVGKMDQETDLLQKLKKASEAADCAHHNTASSSDYQRLMALKFDCSQGANASGSSCCASDSCEQGRGV